MFQLTSILTKHHQKVYKNIQSLTPLQQSNLGWKIKAGLSWDETYIKQQTLADKLSCHRRTIIRGDKLLHEQGLVTKTNRMFMGRQTTNLYEISPVFRDKKLLRAVAPFFEWSFVGLVYCFSVVEAGKLNVTPNLNILHTTYTNRVLVYGKKQSLTGSRAVGRTWFDEFYLQIKYPLLCSKEKAPVAPLRNSRSGNALPSNTPGAKASQQRDGV